MKREQDIQAEKQIPAIRGHGRGVASCSGLFGSKGFTYINGMPILLRGHGDGHAVGRGSVTDCNDGRDNGRERGFWDCSGGFPA